MNGIGAKLELLQPFVDLLSPQRDIIRSMYPGVGGSPAAPPVPPRGLARKITGILEAT